MLFGNPAIHARIDQDVRHGPAALRHRITPVLPLSELDFMCVQEPVLVARLKLDVTPDALSARRPGYKKSPSCSAEDGHYLDPELDRRSGSNRPLFGNPAIRLTDP